MNFPQDRAEMHAQGLRRLGDIIHFDQWDRRYFFFIGAMCVLLFLY